MIKHSRRIESEDWNTAITPQELKDFLLSFEHLPPDAGMTLIMGDIGNQRDPWPILRGLIIEWGDE